MLSLLGDPRCLGCRAVARGFCAACRAELIPAAQSRGLMCAFLYTDLLRSAVLRWKEGGRDDFGPHLAALFAARVHLRADAIVPIPPAFWRTLRRGFHPPRVLAEAIAQDVRAPVVSRALRRVDAARQMGRDRAGRARTLFAPGRALSTLTGKRVLIVDDVVTTGATARQAIAVVETARPAAIAFIALAAVP
jgi:predicted amidophosphoribosyltransferase